MAAHNHSTGVDRTRVLPDLETAHLSSVQCSILSSSTLSVYSSHPPIRQTSYTDTQILPPPGSVNRKGSWYKLLQAQGGGRFLRRHNPTRVPYKCTNQEAKTSETEAFEQAWVGEAQRQGLADRFQVYARGTAAWNQLNRWIERPRHRAAVSEPSGSAAAARRPASLSSCCRNPVCSPLAGQCATSTPALKMILEAADIYSSRYF